MSTLQVANVHLETTGNNRIQYAGSNAYSLYAGGVNVASVNSTTIAVNAAMTVAGSPVLSEGMTVLGTLTLTGTTSQSLTGLNLTNYKQLLFDVNGVSHNSGTSQTLSIGAADVITGATAGDNIYGNIWVSLWNGIAVPSLTRNNTIPAGLATGGMQISQSGYSTATTTITAAISAGSFDAGTIRVYGIR